MQETFVDTDLGAVHTLAVNLASQTTPIVVLPGILLSTRYWESILRRHPYFQHRAAVLVSLPAHRPSTVRADFSKEKVTAESLRRVMDAVMKSLRISDPILMGHSTGGFMVLNAAASMGSGIRGVISIAGFMDGRWSGGEGLLQRLADGNAPARLLFRLAIGVMQRSFWLYFLSAATLTRKAIAFVRHSDARVAMRDAHADFKRNSPRELQAFMAGIYRIRASAGAAAIEAPALILSGKYDPVIPSSETDSLMRTMKAAQSHVFETGHMIFFEDAEGFVNEVSRFVERHACDTKPDTGDTT